MSGWNNKETVLQFIELYRTLPTLWKVRSKDYSNKLTRELAYSKIIEFCRTFEPSADKQFVVNKINNLRTAFRKEWKKVEASKLSGAGTDEIYETRLWYYPYLMFIQEQEVPTTETSNLDTESARPSTSSLGSSHSVTVKSEVPTSPSASSEISEDFTPTETYPQDPSPAPSHSQGQSPIDSSPGPSHISFYGTQQDCSGRPASKMPAAKKPKKRKSEDEEILNAARTMLLNPTPPPSLDENESFGKTIGLLLKNASREQRIYARKLMYEVMAEAELGNLSQASYFVASP